jgi:23S rRNA (uracil-5-)-methyltransferase RumA
MWAALERRRGVNDREAFFKNPFREGATVHLEVDKIAYGGDGIGRVGSAVMFVTGAVPGDIVEARIIEVRKNYLRGYLIEILRPSPHRVEASCPIFQRCGGCQLQELSPERQLVVKEEILRDSFRALEGCPLEELPLQPIIPSPQNLGYRLRCQLKCEWRGDRRVLGFYAKRSRNLVPLESCPLLLPRLNECLPGLARALTELLPPTMELRSVELTTTSDQEHVLLEMLVKGRPPEAEKLYPGFKERIPALAGLGFGPGYPQVQESSLQEVVDGDRYRISLGSFFQVNAGLLGTLRRTAVELLDPGPEDTVVDLYCGVGFFSVPLARRAGSIIGVETNLAAVQDAQYNAKQNGITNIRFMARQAERFRFDRPGGRTPNRPVSMAFLDPPRQGCHHRLLEHLVEHSVRRIAYVSCNPTTLVRDLNTLLQGGYRIRTVQPLDMFPQTYHIETVTILERADSS